MNKKHSHHRAKFIVGLAFIIGTYYVWQQVTTPAPPHYTITVLKRSKGGDTEGVALNNKGQVAGFRFDNGHAIVWDGQNIIDISPDISNAVRLFDINDKGQVLGRGPNGRFLWHQGKTQILPDLKKTEGAYFTALNNKGQTAGTISYSASKFHAAFYDKKQIKDLGTFGGPRSVANGINDQGQVVGFAETAAHMPHAFLYSSGKMQNLNASGGSSRANDINESGQIVGAQGHNACLWQNGRVQKLGGLGGLLRGGSAANSINNKGAIVGIAGIPQPSLDFTSSQTAYHAFLYINGCMHDLNSLIPENSGWILKEAVSINDKGQILCNGFSIVGNIVDSDCALLLNPVKKN